MRDLVAMINRLNPPTHRDYYRLRRILVDGKNLSEHRIAAIIDYETLMFTASRQARFTAEALNIETVVKENPMAYMGLAGGFIDGFVSGAVFVKEQQRKQGGIVLYRADSKIHAEKTAEQFATATFAESLGADKVLYVVECGQGSWTEDQNHWYVADDEGLEKLQDQYEFADDVSAWNREGEVV